MPRFRPSAPLCALATLLVVGGHGNDAPAGQAPKGLVFRLSEAAPAPEPPPPPVAQALTAAEVERVLARLPAPLPDTDSTDDPVLRDPTRPPPRAGVTHRAPFPPRVDRPAPSSGAPEALRVVGHGPEGEVDRGVQVSVTFSQPMVPVSTRADVEAHGLPVRITPHSPGRWRWVGTRTLVFQPEPSLPMATEFVVEVPRGTASMAGGRLSGPVRWTFRTGGPRVVGLLPYRHLPLPRQPTFVALFDQDVRADSVLHHVSVRAGDSTWAVRRATREEMARVDPAGYWGSRADSARRVGFRTAEPLPGEMTIDVVFGAGIPSAEGPLRTDTAQSFRGRTYGPLRLLDVGCAHFAKTCDPGEAWLIELSNPLEESAFSDSLVRIEPTLENARIVARGQYIHIHGSSEPRATYRIVLDPRLRDVFGQTLVEGRAGTIEVGPAPPRLTAAGGSFVVLDPEGPLTHAVRSVNIDSLRVRLYRVEPEDWPTFQAREGNLYQRHRVPTEPPGVLVLSRTIRVDGEPDLPAETAIDISPALRGGLGQTILVVEAAGRPLDGRMRPVYTWIQSTRVGVAAHADARSLIAWTTSLETGRPLEDVVVRVLPDDAGARTDAQGLARVPLRRQDEKGARLVIARRGDEAAILPLSVTGPDSTTGALRWHVLTDRTLYRPEEEVHAKGWLRALDDRPLAEPELPGRSVPEVAWIVRDGVGAELATGRASVGPRGGFDLAFTVPSFADAGQVAIELTADTPAERAGRSHRHTIDVEEFRRPEFEVDVETDATDAIVGGGAEVRIAARYFAGGALPHASIRWIATARPGRYVPPNRGDFTFGGATWAGAEAASHQRMEARADAEGRHSVRLDFDEADPAVAMRVDVSATVSDVNRQAWTETTTLLVHPAAVYVGLRTERRFVRRGEPLTVQAIAVDRDGAAVAGRPLELTIVLVDWTWKDGQWRREERVGASCEVVSTAAPVRCGFGSKPAGLYMVRATTRDDEGRPTLTELPVWIGGGEWLSGPDADTTDGVALLADRDSYQPGDTAQILVHSPFRTAEGMWTLRGAGLARAEGFRMEGPSRMLRIPVEEAHVPNVHVRVDLIASERSAGEHAWGVVELSVPPAGRTLAVRALPREPRLEPGSETVVDVEVRDARGRSAVGSEVAVIVVDEAIWALAGDTVASPIASFYPPRVAATQERDLRNSVLRRGRGGNAVVGAVFDAATGTPIAGAQVFLEGTSLGALTSPDGLYEIRVPGPGRYTVVAQLMGYGTERRTVRVSGDGAVVADFALAGVEVALNEIVVLGERAALPMAAAARAAQQPIALRTDFDALAAFVPVVLTDDDGRASVPVRVPGNLTRYRVIAVAAHGARSFGKGEASLTAALPLMARPSPPRFLLKGDRFELPVVVHNGTDSAVTAEVAVRGTNLDWMGARGFRVALPPSGRVEVRFPAATARAGEASFQVAAVAGGSTDAAQLAVPVRTPATLEAFATYGQVDGNAEAIPVQAPRGVLVEVGGLEVTASSTALSELTDAFLYLTSYPYECAEQVASRVLAVVALRDVLEAFRTPGLPDPVALRDSVRRDVRRLELLQNGDGGFSFWGGGWYSWPLVTAHAAHALVRARDAGYDVRPEVLERAGAYLTRMEQVLPPWWSEDARQTVLGYFIHVRALTGDPDPAGAARVLGRRRIEDAPVEALAWSLPLLAGETGHAELARAVHREILNRATEEAGTAHFVTGYSDDDYLTLHSSRRADAVVLETLLREDRDHPLNPKLVRGLLGNRSRGRWLNTQENVFVILALSRWFAEVERTPPDFTARVWLGDRFAGERSFEGYSPDRFAVEVPMAWLAEGAEERDLVIQKDGPGRLYYRAGMRYAPATLDLPPVAEGFALERRYEAVDDSTDVVQNDDGTWVVRAGARVRVRITLAAQARRTHVALIDPLPAGLEPLNPELRGSGPPQVGQGLPQPGWRRQWYEHQNLRDDRAEAFASLLWAGAYTYTYLTRATTPGEYTVPPPRAEEMYQPETMGRGTVDRVTVRP